MNRRYQVFVSSTFLDLVEERRQVIQALLELRCIPAVMEAFPAASEDQWSLIRRVVDESDYYVVIVGGRYGTLADDGVGYTEKEFDYAVAQGKPILAFLHRDPSDLPLRRSETDENQRKKLDHFRKKVEKGRVVRYWATPEELGGTVSRSLVQATNASPGEGWVRASEAGDPIELVRLQELVASLESKMSTRLSQRPPGTEDLAQGNDLVKLHFEYNTSDDDAGAVTIPVTWDQVFACIGPLMFESCGEPVLQEALSNAFFDWWTDDIAAEYQGRDGDDVELLARDLHQVKIQFLALGMIEKGGRAGGKRGGDTFWSLTEFGEAYLVRQLAVRKKKKPKAAVGSVA